MNQEWTTENSTSETRTHDGRIKRKKVEVHIARVREDLLGVAWSKSPRHHEGRIDLAGRPGGTYYFAARGGEEAFTVMLEKMDAVLTEAARRLGNGDRTSAIEYLYLHEDDPEILGIRAHGVVA